jgi:HEPN domain-containing protein
MTYLAWLAQAEDDLEAAKVLSVANHHSQAVWLAAQAVEKGHKAILLALGLRYQDEQLMKLGHEIANVLSLLPEALHEPKTPEIAGFVATIQSLVKKARYPAAIHGAIVAPAVSVTSSQSEEALKAAAPLLDWCRARILRAVRATDAMRSR